MRLDHLLSRESLDEGLRIQVRAQPCQPKENPCPRSARSSEEIASYHSSAVKGTIPGL